MNQRIFKLFLLTCLALAPQQSVAGSTEGPIKLRYFPRPPFIVSSAGRVSGVTAALAVGAFEQSGIPFELLETPTNQQIILINRNEEANCAIGWLRNPEREKFARFTEPIYHSRPWLIIANNRSATMPHRNLDEWMKNQKLCLVISERYSYGPYIDDKIKQNAPHSFTTTADAQQLIRLVASGRADYMFSTEEEAAFLIKSAKANSSVRTIQFKEIPTGETRHIMCSKNVSPETIAKLNRFLLKPNGGYHK